MSLLNSILHSGPEATPWSLRALHPQLSVFHLHYPSFCPFLSSSPLTSPSIQPHASTLVCTYVSLSIPMTTSTLKPIQLQRIYTFASHLHVSRATGSIRLWLWQGNWHDPVRFLCPLYLSLISPLAMPCSSYLAQSPLLTLFMPFFSSLCSLQ